MPPKRLQKKSALEDQVELALGELEIKVDAMRSEVEASLNSTVSEMRRLIDSAVLRLPTRIRNMTMQEFLHEYGGKLFLLIMLKS